MEYTWNGLEKIYAPIKFPNYTPQDVVTTHGFFLTPSCHEASLPYKYPFIPFFFVSMNYDWAISVEIFDFFAFQYMYVNSISKSWTWK